MKIFTLLALRRGVPIHLVSSNRVILLAHDAEAILPLVSIQQHVLKDDRSEGLTASKGACEVFLERLAEEILQPGIPMPITTHRPCSRTGDETPSDDALNSIPNFSMLKGYRA